MIPCRSSCTGPRLALASALAFAVPLWPDCAVFAQTAAGSVGASAVPATQVPPSLPGSPAAKPSTGGDADILKQRDQELDEARTRERESAETQAKLRREIESLGDDRRALNQQLIDTAARVRDIEASIEATRARLLPLDDREAAFRKSLDNRRAAMIEILAVLQRVGRQPPPALLVQPEDALQAVRAAMTLGTMIPEMRAAAAAVAGDLAELVRVRKDIADERQRLVRELDSLGREQLRLSTLIEERQSKQTATEEALAAERERAANLAQQVNTLKDLIAKLEAGLDPATRAARAAARAIEEDATKPDLAALKDPGRLAPAAAFATLRGHLRWPVNGVKVREFGASDGLGGTEKGMSIATRPGAQITSPCDGWVVYAGTFRSYGQLLILNAGGGYHVLLAGMERISVDLGQFVLTGEPIAVMGGGSQVSAVVATKSKQPVLYVEFRKDGTPIDPGPWWATNEGEKVRG
jgi:septal ring factor EnvC (AmiA/AmiB activator)